MLLPPAAPLVSLFFFTSLALAVIYAPDCTVTDWAWTFNSLGQNPCTVAAHMMSTCHGGSFSVAALLPGYEYVGPQGSSTDDGDLCKCNTVAYSLLSACDACQGSEWRTWSEYVANCTKILPPSSFPNPIPAGTSLPPWALLDVITGNYWNNNYARTISGVNPDLGPGTILGPSGPSVSTSTGPTNGNPSTPASSSTSSVSGSSFPYSATPIATPTATPSSHSGTAAGVAVGVAVGAIVAISIVIAALLYYRRRQRPPAPLTESASDEQPGGSSPLMDQVPPQSMSGRETAASSLPETTTSQLRRYNPEDPTTYPTYQGTLPPTMYGPFQSPSSSSRNLYTLATPPDPQGQGPGSSSSNRDLYTVVNAQNSQGQGPGYGGLPIV